MNQSFILAKREQIPSLVAHLERSLSAGKPLRVTIGARPSRSREQLAYLHVALRELAEHTGTDETTLKDYFKTEFGPELVVRIGNRTSVIRKSIADYSQQEASDMIEHVSRVAAECGLLLAPTGTL